MPTSLRIAIDGRPALWPRTGIGTITHHVLKRIQDAAPDAEIRAYFDTDPRGRTRDYRLAGTAFGGPRQKMLWANTWLRKRLAQDRIDVYVTFLDKEIPLVRTQSRIVCMIHDLIPLRSPETFFRNAMHRLYYQRMFRAAARRADLVLTNSVFSKREILDTLPVDESKLHVVPLGVEAPVSISPERRADTLRRHNLTRPYVLALGSTEPRKNNRRVIEAMRLLVPAHPALRVAIAGSPRRDARFEPALLDERVVQLGHISNADLSVLMGAAEMLAFPSLHEGFGLPLIEAMAHGTPVVASDVTAIPEVAGDAALYVDPLNAADIAAQMHALLSDPQLRAQLRRAGLARAASFRWSLTCSSIMRLCRGLTESSVHRSESIAS